jgi:hypothetical protein
MIAGTPGLRSEEATADACGLSWADTVTMAANTSVNSRRMEVRVLFMGTPTYWVFYECIMRLFYHIGNTDFR